MRLGRNAVVAAGIGVAIVAVAAVVATSLARPAPRIEVGVVVFVDSVSLTDIRRFAIRTPDGRTVEFRVGQLENEAQFPPAHLGEHQATTTPVLVTYQDENGEHVAIRLEDVPAAFPS